MMFLNPSFMAFITVPALILIAVLIFVANQYKRCPSNKVIVVYGKTGGTSTAKCVHGGGTFIIPLIQDYGVLSLEPMTTDIDLKGALSKGNIRVAVPSTFTFGISTKDSIMINAAERLLGLSKQDIIVQASDIILGQLRLAIATLTIEEINQDREKFLEQINANVNTELNKIGLEIINVNIKDITDESGYIDAIGKKAAAEAINKAKVEVAQQEKLGAVGEAEANKEKEVQVAEQTAQTEIGKTNADKEQRIKTASLEAEAVEGENIAKANIADYNATLAVKQADALKLGEVAKANAERDVLIAQKEREEAKLKKEELARQEVEKLKIQVEADAEAERQRRIALGEADAIKAKYFAEAEGVRAVLEAKAKGYEELVKISNNKPEIATSFLMIEKIEDIVGKQVEAIKNIKFDKITVWDGGAGSKNGSTTANFMRDLIKALPAMHDLAGQAGVELPAILGKVASQEDIETEPAPVSAKPEKEKK
ncbi:flotillin [Candidatus Gastranaerophilales bacterium]|nr:MAG: flotillin [Candidatus Gastranaerophilales bacterium]